MRLGAIAKAAARSTLADILSSDEFIAFRPTCNNADGKCVIMSSENQILARIPTGNN